MITQKLMTTASKALVLDQEGEGKYSKLSLKLYLIVAK